MKQIIRWLSFLAIALASVVWLAFIRQPLVGRHAPREAQTAITSLFLFRDGTNLFNYETPVFGFPWKLPMEFPLYQLLTRLISGVTHLDLVVAGRILSVLCAFVAAFLGWRILGLLGASRLSKYVFLLLYFSSPIYLYYGRAYLIELFALCLLLVAVFLYIRLRFKPEQDHNHFHFYFLAVGFALSLILSIMTKATTALPFALFCGFDQMILLGAFVRNQSFVSWQERRQAIVNSMIIIAILLCAVFLLKTWVSYADYLKSLNVFSETWTSSSLSSWNYGTLAQRLDPMTWIQLLRRVATAWGAIPFLLLIALGFLKLPFQQRAELRFAFGFFSILALLPFLLFTNLHRGHDYYQAANLIFFYLVACLAIDNIRSAHDKPGKEVLLPLALVSVVIIAMGGFFDIFADYKTPHLSNAYMANLRIEDSPALLDGALIRRVIPPNSVVIHAFYGGPDFPLAYYSNRRTVGISHVPRRLVGRHVNPDGEKRYSNGYQGPTSDIETLLINLDSLVGDNKIGAFLIGSDLAPGHRQKIQALAKARRCRHVDSSNVSYELRVCPPAVH
jgi:hypothetical protein